MVINDLPASICFPIACQSSREPCSRKVIENHSVLSPEGLEMLGLRTTLLRNLHFGDQQVSGTLE